MTLMRVPRHSIPRLSGMHCPVCDQPIPTEKVDQARARLEARELEVSEEVGKRLNEQFAHERTQLEVRAREALERSKQEAAAALQRAAQETVVRETAAREQGTAAARKEAAEMLARAETEKAAAIVRYDALQAQHDGLVERRVAEVTEQLESARTEAVNAIKIQHFEEKQKLTGRLEDLARQLERKSAEERGEGAEVDLFEDLRKEYPRDDIKRVVKGAAGPDIVHDVYHKEKFCGRIIYDCKDRSVWRNEYAIKLREDQNTANAMHAIVSSRVFPAGARQLCEVGGVLVANPARVVALIHLLRRHMIQVEALRLSGQQRDKKTERLYDFVTSDRCVHLFDRIEAHSNDLARLQQKEKKDHETHWRRQDALHRAVHTSFSELRSEMDAIISAA